MSFVLGLIVLGVVVLIHELGHFLAARSFGIRVEKFSIGFGPALLQRRVGDTVYAISAIPLGGYVKMAGEHPEEGREGAPDEFLSKHWAQRFVVVVAGPLMNLVLAVVANCLVGIVGYQVSTPPNIVDRVGPKSAELGFAPGDRIVSAAGSPVTTWHGFMSALEAAKPGETVPVKVDRGGEVVELAVPQSALAAIAEDLEARADPVIGEVAPGMPAFQANLRRGDRIVSVNGQPVATWDDMRAIINARPDEEVEIAFERDGKPLTTRIRTLAQNDPTTGKKIGVIGITLPSVSVTLPPGEAIAAGLEQTWAMVGATYRGFVDLVAEPRQAARQVAGPITIAQIAGDSVVGAPGVLLIRMAFISVALMALNLLPIPILDGGHALLFLIEGLRGSPVSLKAQMAFQKVGLVFIGFLVVFSIVNDSMRLVERVRSHRDLKQQVPATGSP
jgi:regulator of sigma E protease